MLVLLLVRIFIVVGFIFSAFTQYAFCAFTKLPDNNVNKIVKNRNALLFILMIFENFVL